MSAMVNKVLITVKSSFEYGVRQDIRDYLFFFDRDVSVRATEFRGVLIVETNIDPKYVAGLLINAPIPENVLTSIIPIIHEGSYNTINDLIDVVRRYVSSDCETYVVRCRLRGSLISDSDCESSIINLLRGLGFHAMYRGGRF
ncbi:THUMP domain-containing protein [Vulcanisaeta distributa]|uniref:THUMP domain-containing protein n=1 Tax=Vulcanisaeta distributa TaxID=164451 RepID=UPI000ADB6524|nr:THUMP domain-containing protein [Vulcanisaeta distributa]